MFNLMEELSTDAQELLVGGQGQGQQQQSGPPKSPQKSGGATGYIVPDNNPENYFTWRLDKAPQMSQTSGQ